MNRHPRAYATAFVALLWLLAGALHAAGPAQTARAQEEPRYQAYLPRVDAGGAKAIDTRIELSDLIGCRLDDEGGVVCWDLEYGERLPSLPGRYTQLSMSGWGICGLRDDGQVICDGIDGTGAWSAPPGPYTQVRVSGGDSACALSDAGAIRCWRWEGLWEDLDGPRAYPGPTGVFEQLAVSGSIVCGLKTDATLACMDWLEGGPEWPGPMAGITQLEMEPSGTSGALLLRSDGSTLWWDLESGAIKDGPQGPFRQISWRGWPACALDAQGAMHCWEGLDQALSPLAGAFRSVTAADGFVCAERASGTPACWRWEWDSEEWTALPVP